MADLPWPVPEKKWRPADPEHPDYPALKAALDDAIRKPGWHPKTIKLSDGMLAIDLCAEGDDLHSYQVADVTDHPFLATLPANAPRVVKHLYRSATRVRYARADSGWALDREFALAKKAWREYRANA